MDQETLIPTFLAVTGIEDEAIAKQYLDLTDNNLELAATLYMESNPPTTASTHHNNDDEELAQRLQQEAYQNDDGVRQADANIHRHETLVDSFDGGMSAFPRPSRPTDIFGQGRIGIFNQRFDDDETEYYSNRVEEEDEDDDYEDEDDDVMELNSDGEVVPSSPPRSRRRINRDSRIGELNSTQRRLASLFRPPFDLMARVDFDTAKVQGRSEKKWILINIQDSSEFQCQVLNRDFWSNIQVKNKVKQNFIFLQYQHDSPNGEHYVNFYSASKFPHIAILDPLTGERVFKWIEGEVPDVESWLYDVDKFLDQFLLTNDSKNPIVEHEQKFDPGALTEEQQIEFAIKQSMNGGTSETDPITIDDDTDIPEEPVKDPFDAIQPSDHPEPTSGTVTRIQVRFPNGKRLVHKFDAESDKVATLYEWLKHILANSSEDDYGLLSQDRFILTNTSNRSLKLIECTSSTIDEVGLKNASILLEKE